MTYNIIKSNNKLIINTTQGVVFESLLSSILYNLFSNKGYIVLLEKENTSNFLKITSQDIVLISGVQVIGIINIQTEIDKLLFKNSNSEVYINKYPYLRSPISVTTFSEIDTQTSGLYYLQSFDINNSKPKGFYLVNTSGNVKQVSEGIIKQVNTFSDINTSIEGEYYVINSDGVHSAGLYTVLQDNTIKFNNDIGQGISLPDPSTTPFKLFFLHSQTNEDDDGVYILISNTHFIQIIKAVSNESDFTVSLSKDYGTLNLVAGNNNQRDFNTSILSRVDNLPEPIEIQSIDLKPTGVNSNEFIVEIIWVDSSGITQTTVDPTPIQINIPSTIDSSNVNLLDSGGNYTSTNVEDALSEIISKIGNISHTSIQGIDLKPTGINPNEFTISINWLDSSGSLITTSDPTPISISVPPNKFTDGTNTSDAVFIGGNVGIGVNDPTVKLEIKGLPGESVAKLDLVAASGDTILELSADDSQIAGGSNFLNCTAGGGSRVVIKGDGKIGIGTLTPTEELDVQGNAKIYGTAIIGKPSILGVNPPPFMKLGTGSNVSTDLNTVGDLEFVMKKGNLFFKSGGTSYDGAFNVGNFPRSLVGLSADRGLSWGAIDVNTLFDHTTHGEQSLAAAPYTYGDKMVDRGFTNVHPDMYGTSFITMTSQTGYFPKMQLAFDQKGQLFVRGYGSYADTEWKKFVSEGTKIYPPLINASLYGNGYEDPFYVREGKTIYLGGMISVTAVNAPLFTLPVGFRPLHRKIFYQITGGGMHYVYVETNGDVTTTNSGIWVSLESINFRID